VTLRDIGRSRPSGALLATSLLAALGVSSSEAHHSIAIFDPRTVVTITGTVMEFRWTNPHAYIQVEGVADGEAVPARWNVEMSAPNSMMDEGWTRDTLKAGDRVTVFANPLREVAHPYPGHRRVLYVRVTLPDGSSLGRKK
jgi:hypothetical protein